MSPQTTTPPPPETVETRCAVCREETEHEVVKGKVVRGGLGVEGTFKCLECDRVHTGLVSFPAPLDIPFIVSSGEEAEPHAVQIFEDDQVAVGDEFEIDDTLVEVTAVELKDQDRRVRRAQAQDIKTLWGKNINTIRVGFALNIGPRTMSFEADFGPEDEVAVGDEFEYEDGDVVVERIVTEGGKRFSGSYNVREIKRVWLVRKGAPRKERRDPTVPRGQKEQRAASREKTKRGGPRPGGRPKRTGGGAGPSRGGPWSGGGSPGPSRSGGGSAGPSRSGGSGGGSRGGPRSGGSGGGSRGGPRGGGSGGGSRGGPRGGGSGGGSRGGPRSGGSGGGSRGGPRSGGSGGGSRGGPRSGGDRSRGRRSK